MFLADSMIQWDGCDRQRLKVLAPSSEHSHSLQLAHNIRQLSPTSSVNLGESIQLSESQYAS